MKAALLIICLALVSCSGTDIPTGDDSVVCFEIDAATLLTMVSATTSIRGVAMPSGNEYTFEQVLELVNACYGGGPDPTVLALVAELSARGSQE